MRVGYPRTFRLTGYAELRYVDYSSKRTVNGREREHHYSNLKQTYRLVLEGYVYHPRLLVFYSGITFRDYRRLTGSKYNGQTFLYFVDATFLPYRPINLNVYAQREHDYSEFANTDFESTLTRYGARLNILLRRFQAAEKIVLRYEHTDQSPYNLKTDTYSLRISGHLKLIRTSYGLALGVNQASTQTENLTSRYFSFGTLTGFKKYFRLSNSYSFIDRDLIGNDSLKYLRFRSYLDFPLKRKFNHSYNYNYQRTERFFAGSEAAGTTDTTTKYILENIVGNWSYRFTDRLNSGLSLYYGTEKQDSSSKRKIYSLSTHLTYRRFLLGFSSTSQYRFFFRKREERGDMNEHQVSIELTTQKFGLGTTYLGYYFINLYEKNLIFDAPEEDFFTFEEEEARENIVRATSHTLVIGTRGRFRGKILRGANWIIESQLYQSRSKRTFERNIETEFFENEIGVEEKIDERLQFSLYGQLNHRLTAKLRLNSRAKFITGESNSKSKKSFTMEHNITYLLYRNIDLSGWWRERWYDIEDSPEFRQREFELELRFRKGKLFVTLNYLLSYEMEEQSDRRTGRLYVRMRRVL